ncbi:MAG TPA: inositol monophosphatase family protein [Candidatus Baltobacteraceae bacterium]|jgi:myo-inositol-1(or 4)-monophosphatase
MTSVVVRNAPADPLRVALDAALEAGELLISHMNQPLNIREKDRRADIVTAADRASERIIVARLAAAFPHATILGEESGTRRGTSDERWIVDPLDGTTNYAHGYPLFCVSIAFERAGEIVAGVVHAPLMRETFAAQRGAGATRNGEPITVSTIGNVADALTCTGFHPADFDRNARCFRAVSERAQGVRRDGSAALDLAYVAAGRFDGFWEWDLHAWDVAAGTLLVREAGGRVTQIDGSEARVEAGSILASNGIVHEELRAVLAVA